MLRRWMRRLLMIAMMVMASFAVGPFLLPTREKYRDKRITIELVEPMDQESMEETDH